MQGLHDRTHTPTLKSGIINRNSTALLHHSTEPSLTHIPNTKLSPLELPLFTSTNSTMVSLTVAISFHEMRSFNQKLSTSRDQPKI